MQKKIKEMMLNHSALWTRSEHQPPISKAPLFCVHSASLCCSPGRARCLQPSLLLLASIIFLPTPSSCSEITHDLAIDRVVLLLRCHSKSPSKPISVTMLQAEYILRPSPHHLLHFFHKPGVSIQFLHRSCAKKQNGNQIRAVLKAFP